jgi:3-oxoacyl-[acyl-carrier protein] reductase
MDLGLEGRIAIITGGTAGIGRAVADVLAAEGCSIGLCARSEDGVEETVESLREAGVSAFGRALDVADAAALSDWVESAAEALGGLDLVVANVSALGSGEGEEQWRRAVDVDLMHTVRVVEAGMPYLEDSDAPSVVIVSSVSAREARSGAAYGSVKAALNHYGHGLAVELAPRGIRVNVVSPGTIYVEDGFWGRVRRRDPDHFERMRSMNPMGRMGRPEEVARAVAFLASPAGSFVSGTNLLVDGALTTAVPM